MDKRAAAQYLDKLFGTRTGYVAVAHKDADQPKDWQEHQFSWPRDKNKLIGWAEVHQDANVFICPALRKDPHTRKKGDMHPSQWLWADVDWQNVPEGKHDEVHSRINELGTYIVASGSGDNAHVYVELDKPVPHEEFIKLNTGLRDYLYADNKQADNSLLRLPGTTNWKTDAGSPVASRGGNGRKTTQATLLKRRIFRDAKVITDVDAQEWSFVEVEGLPRRVKAMVEMDVPQAENRYGSRFKAVWAITGELHKRGLGVDEIHSLMDKFPPALSKAADENGYDVHRDVDKRIAWDRTKVSVVDDDEMDEDAGDVFEEMSVEQVESSRLTELAEQIRLRMRARRLAEQLEAASGYTRPPDDTTTWLSDALKQPPAPVQWLIEGLCSADATVVIAGQYKTGKTKLMIASLISALVDGEPFLGTYNVHVPDGGAKVGHWNLEMSATDLIDKYMRPVGYQNTGNIKLANWRGQPGNILTDLGKADAVEWLKGLDVWTIDSWTALCRMCGVDPNSGKEVGQLLAHIEEIKVQSGVKVCFFLAHTARASAESDRPGTRGASELDDHVDSRWMLTVDKSDVRFMQAQGRDTDMSAVSLDFNNDTGRSTIGAVTRQSAAQDGLIQLIVKILKDKPEGLNQGTLVKLVREVNKRGVQTVKDAIKEAEDDGFIRIVPISRSTGRTEHMHMLADMEKPQGDRRMNATPQEVNLSGIPMPSRRRK